MLVRAESFGKEKRLNTASDFKGVFSNTQVKAACPEVLLLARRNDGEGPRLGLVVAKKQIKLATGRNRIKRLIRESFRQHQQELPNLDIVVLPRKSLAGLDNAAVLGLLHKQWKRLIKRSNTNTAADTPVS